MCGLSLFFFLNTVLSLMKGERCSLLPNFLSCINFCLVSGTGYEWLSFLKLFFPLWCRKVEEAVSNEVELQIHGVEKPSVWKLYGVQFILLPYFIGKASSCLLNLCVWAEQLAQDPPLQLQPFGLACSCLESLTWSILTELHATFLWQVLTWEICWFWRYRVKKLPYAWEDACYLTQTSLKIPASTWKNIGNLQFHQTNVGFSCGWGYGGKRCTRGSILDIGDWISLCGQGDYMLMAQPEWDMLK